MNSRGEILTGCSRCNVWWQPNKPPAGSRFIRAVLRDCRKAPRPSRAATTNIEFSERG